jgi:hypothetical protein
MMFQTIKKNSVISITMLDLYVFIVPSPVSTCLDTRKSMSFVVNSQEITRLSVCLTKQR